MPRAVAVKRVASTVAAPTPRASPEPSVPLLESSPSTITATSVAVTLVPVGSPAPLPVEPVVESVSVVPPVAEAPAADENVAQMSRPEKRSRCDSPSSASSKEGGASAALSVFSDVPSPVLLPAHAAGGVSSLVTTPSGASSSPAVGVPPSNKVQDADDMFSDDVFAAIPILTPPVAAAGDSVERRANGGWAIAPLSGPAPLEPEDGWDDGEGYYKPSIGELIAGRYRVTECVGQGMFACVVRAVDTQGGRSVAVKIIRANDMMTRAAEKEAALCRRLAGACVL